MAIKYKVGFISDVHGNLSALETVKADLKFQGIEMCYCLGDVIGYGPDPRACLDEVREIADVIIMGNHEAAIHQLDLLKYMNNLALVSRELALKQLTTDDLDFIEKLPEIDIIEIEGLNIALAHGSFRPPHALNYVENFGYAQADLDKMAASDLAITACFIGHMHIPKIYGRRSNQNVTSFDPEELIFQKDCLYSINVGSVGQPRDSDNRAAYGILQIETDQIRYYLRRLNYDYQATQKKIIAAGLPALLAQRLKDAF